MITELITSFVFAALLTLFSTEKIISSDVVLIFTLIGFIGSVSLMFSFRTRGFVFLLGWILAAWVLRGLFNPVDFLVYLIAPVVAVMLKTWFAFKKTARRARIL